MPKKKKGIVGIEAAIVLIAFVIVAAALAFVVLNMGMYTTQKSKEVMSQALNEASSALEVDGSVMAYVLSSSDITHQDYTGFGIYANKNAEGKVVAILIPLKISPGQQAVDLSKDKIDVVIRLPNGTYAKANTEDPKEATAPVDYKDLVNDTLEGIQTVKATFYFVQSNQAYGVPAFNVLEIGEKVVLVIVVSGDLALKQYEKFVVEVRPLAGAPLTVERVIPPTLPVGEFASLL